LENDPQIVHACLTIISFKKLEEKFAENLMKFLENKMEKKGIEFT